MIWESNQHTSPNYSSRASMYGVGGIPHAQFGGIHEVVGGGTNMYPYYVTRYNWIVGEDSPMEIAMNLHYNESGDLIFAADVEMTGDISTSNNKIIFLITKYWSDSYFCTVSTYQEVDFDLTSTGETGSYESVLELDEAWDLDDLKAAVIVQTFSGDHLIHQANIADIQSIMQILSPVSLDFGEVPVGESVTEPVYITNYWDEELSGAIFPIPGFEIATNFSVPPNQTASVDLTFAPEEEIYYDSFIILMSNNEYFQTQLLPVTGTGIPGSNSDDELIDVSQFDMSNHPNPFNPTTTIFFNLPENISGNTELTIFNLNGQQVKHMINQPLPAGEHSIVWDGTDDAGLTVPSGLYFYKINTDKLSRTKKMLLLK